MKKDQVHVGHTYVAKVSDKLTRVRIDGENAHGGWDATNLATSKKVRIKSAQRLRGPAPERVAQARAEAPATPPAAPASATPEAAKPAKSKKAKAAKADKAEKKPRKPSGLDAAAKVLKDAGEPMRCKDMVEKMLAKGLWQTGGKTPAATIYAAILREIQAKGGEARFRKTDRGLFTINAK